METENNIIVSFLEGLVEIFSKYGFENYINRIEEEIDRTIKRIGSYEEWSGAKTQFSLLNKIQSSLSILTFKYNIVLTPKLREFVRNFDRLDDERQLKYLFDLVKKGDYSFFESKQHG